MTDIIFSAAGPQPVLRFLRRAALLAGAATLLAACQFGMQQPTDEGIGFRAQRFEAIEAMRDYRACVDDALELDHQAYATQSAAKYLASAKLLESCEAKLGPGAADVADDERMHAASAIATLALTFTLLGISLGIGTLAETELTPDTVQDVIAGLTEQFSLAFLTSVIGLPVSAGLRALLLLTHRAIAAD